MSDTVQCGYCGKPVSTTEYRIIKDKLLMKKEEKK